MSIDGIVEYLVVGEVADGNTISASSSSSSLSGSLLHSFPHRNHLQLHHRLINAFFHFALVVCLSLVLAESMIYVNANAKMSSV